MTGLAMSQIDELYARIEVAGVGGGSPASNFGQRSRTKGTCSLWMLLYTFATWLWTSQRERLSRARPEATPVFFLFKCVKVHLLHVGQLAMD
jgi:hypothetical protein